MDRCEHGEKIDRFCASECCVWRQGAGCSNVCMKKYHNHMGPSILVPEKEVQALLKKYKVDNWVKPKVKTLEQAIHNYFNLLKIELNNYIDEVDKKLRTELCYPYLSKHGIVQVYKKLKKRQYRKVQQREFRQFYEQTVSLKPEDFAKQERHLYEQELNRNRIILLELFRTFTSLEDGLKSISMGNINFQVDKNYEQKVRSVFDSISFTKRNTEEDLDEEIKEKFQDLSVCPNKKIQTKPSKQLLQKQKPFISKWASTGKTTRKKSLDLSNDSAHVESSSLHKDLQKKASRKSRQELDKMKNQIVNLMSNPKKQQAIPFDLTVTGPTSQTTRINTNYSESSSRQNIDSKPAPTYANKNYLTVDTKPANVSSSIQSLALSDKFGSKTKEKVPQNQISEVRHNQLPSQKSNAGAQQKQRKRPTDLRPVVVPFKGDKTLEPDEMSPLYQKRKKFFASVGKQKKKEGGFELISVKEESPTKQQIKSPQKLAKPKPNTEEQKSIQLLTKAVQSKAEDAVPLLKQALKLAPNNLSAAEYLSFLLLEAGDAKQCLRICNSIHEQLQDQMIYEPNLFHINNNRAVALLMLGRYSQAIVGLEKSLSIDQNALTYKNLGDAYYSIGIYEKAVYNYEKSISLKPAGQTYYNLAVCLYVQQNFHNSLIMAELAVGLAPEVPEYTTLVKEIKSSL